MTFNAKNLHYEKQEPAFLRQFRAENTSDRHNVSIARPRKPRLETGDDDGPTIVDEQGENLTKQEYQDLLRGKTKDESESGNIATSVGLNPKLESPEALPHESHDKAKERDTPHAMASSDSGAKKRKQVKAVAVEPESEHEVTNPGNGFSHSEIKKTRTKNRSKKKKVKLSFDDPKI